MIIATIFILFNFIVFANVKDSNIKVVLPIVFFTEIYFLVMYYQFYGNISNKNYIVFLLNTSVFYIMTTIILIVTYIFFESMKDEIKEEIAETFKYNYYKQIPFRIELIKDFINSNFENNTIDYFWVNSSNKIILPVRGFSSLLLDLNTLINLQAPIYVKRTYAIIRKLNSNKKEIMETTNTNIKNHGESIKQSLNRLLKHYKTIREDGGDLQKGKIISYEIQTGLYRHEKIREYMNLNKLKEKLEKKITKYLLYNEDNMLFLYNGKKLRIITSIYNRKKHIKIYYALKYIMKHNKNIKDLKCEIVILKQGKVKYISLNKILKEGENFLYGEPQTIILKDYIENPFENIDEYLAIKQ